MLSGMKLPCGIVYNKESLKKGTNIDDVPHLIDIEGLECLLTVYGRKYLCLTCDKVGHKAKNCTTPYCNKCRKLMPRKHQCEPRGFNPRSYANVVKATEANLINIVHEEDTSVEILCGSKHTTQEIRENHDDGDSRSGPAESLKLVKNPEKIVKKDEQPVQNNSREDLIKVVNVLNDNYGESQEDQNLECNWDDTGEGSGEEKAYNDSEEDSNTEETIREGFTKMEKHLSELKRISDDVKINRKDSLDTDAAYSSNKSVSEDNMELVHMSLKRKSESPFENPVEESSFSGPRITYRSSGARRGTRRPHSKSNKNTNITKMW